jgi:hypothetical protein
MSPAAVAAAVADPAPGRRGQVVTAEQRGGGRARRHREVEAPADDGSGLLAER